MEKCADMSSSDEDETSDDDDDDDDAATTTSSYPTHTKDDKTKTQKFIQSTSYFRFVTRLNNRYSLSKMSTAEEIRTKVLSICSSDQDVGDIVKMVNDSNSDAHDDDDNDVVSTDLNIQHEKKQVDDGDINDLRQKVVEYEQQQLKGVQFINAGDRNPKVVNNYAVTSGTCTLI